MDSFKKKIIFNIFVIIISPFLGFCQNDKKNVVATINIISDIARQIAGDEIVVQSLLPTGTDPHIYDPIPRDAITLGNADLILVNGLTLEGWIKKLIVSANVSGKVITVSRYIKPIENTDIHNATDPHAWMSPQNGILYAQAITEAFTQLLPQKTAYFENRFITYKHQLDSLDFWIRQEIQKIPPENRTLITTHDAFRYYASHYGLSVRTLIGTSTDAEIAVSGMESLIAEISTSNVPAVFVEATTNPKALAQIAADYGLTLGDKLYADSMGETGSGADSYIGMLAENTKRIVAGLTSSRTQTRKFPIDNALFIVVLTSFIAAFWLLTKLILKRSSTPDSNAENKITIQNLSVGYSGRMILTNCSLELYTGKIYGILGANGSGKSTFLKAVLGIVPIQKGTISLYGKPLSTMLRYIAYLPQKDEVDIQFPVTVRDVVKMGLYPGKKVFETIPKTEISRIEKAMELLEIKQLADFRVSELSGGQLQRTFMARAICQQADVFFLDEPFTGVDAATEIKMMQLFKELAKNGKLIIMIHHDISKVEEYFDEVILINKRIVAAGPVKTTMTSENITKTYGGAATLLVHAEELMRNQKK